MAARYDGSKEPGGEMHNNKLYSLLFAVALALLAVVSWRWALVLTIAIVAVALIFCGSALLVVMIAGAMQQEGERDE